MQTKGKEDNTMKQKGLRIALLFALVLSISQAVPAFAAHKLLDANSYTLTQTEQGVAISGKDGKSVTGWVQDKEGNFYYFKKGSASALPFFVSLSAQRFQAPLAST